MSHPSYGPLGQRVVISEFGETPPDTIERHLSLEPQNPPDPSTLKETDVVVAVRSASVNWVDLLMTSGQYQHMPSPPYTPGLEYSGDIAWAGAAVDPAQVKVGDRVLSDGFWTGPRSLGDYQQWGGFASYAVAPAYAVIKLPERLTYDQGCNLLGNYETAYHCLVTCGKLRRGETVLILGASGSTGLAAVQIAKLLEAKVIAAGRSPAKLAEVEAQGADHLVRTPTPDDPADARRFSDEIKALTGGEGVQVVYDGVGGPLSVYSMHAAAFGARFLIVGWASTPFVAKGKGQRGAPNVNVLPTNLMMMKGLHVIGCPTVISSHRDPSLRVERLAALMRWLDDGSITPLSPHPWPLSEVKAAMLAKWESRFSGGCVLHP